MERCKIAKQLSSEDYVKATNKIGSLHFYSFDHDVAYNFIACAKLFYLSLFLCNSFLRIVATDMFEKVVSNLIYR